MRTDDEFRRQTRMLEAFLSRLQNIDSKDLYYVVPHVARSMLDCRDMIGSASQTPKSAGGGGLVIWKLMTLISSFLNDKTPDKRWAAVVLIKTFIDAAGRALITSNFCGQWIQGLLSLLKKQDPYTSKRLAIIALTRIFLLTHSYQSLVRELTTPALSPFITQCLASSFPKSASGVNISPELAPVVLESFSRLLPSHPTIFRTFTTQIQAAIKPLLAPAPSLSSSTTVDDDLARSARKLFALLPYTAPKNGSSDEWNKAVNNAINETHQTADHVFRCIVEDWTSSSGYIAPARQGPLTAGDPEQDTNSPLQLPSWVGIHAGCERVSGLLQVIQALVASQTTAVVAVPLGPIHDLLVRLLSITIPSETNASSNLRNNEEISKAERDAAMSHLISIHADALILVDTLCARFQQRMLPQCLSLLDQIDWVFGRERFSDSIRQHVFAAVAHLIRLFGAAFTKPHAKPLHRIVRAACEDIVPLKSAPSTSSTASNSTSATSILDNPSASKTSNEPPALSPPSPLRAVASTLLTVYLAKVPAQHMPLSTRALADRTAILSRNEDAMLASTLNPPAGGDRPRASVLPLLARAHPDSLAVEALVRPRMPVIHTLSHDDEIDADDEQGDGEENDDGDDAANGDSAAFTEHLVPLPDGMEGLSEDQLDTSPPLHRPSSPQPPPSKRAKTSRHHTPDVTASQSQEQASNAIKAAPNTVTSTSERKGKARAPPAEDVEMGESATTPQSAQEHTVTAADVQMQEAAAPPAASVTRKGDEDSDDEEFVMPTLTLDSDSD